MTQPFLLGHFAFLLLLLSWTGLLWRIWTLYLLKTRFLIYIILQEANGSNELMDELSLKYDLTVCRIPAYSEQSDEILWTIYRHGHTLHDTSLQLTDRWPDWPGSLSWYLLLSKPPPLPCPGQGAEVGNIWMFRPRLSAFRTDSKKLLWKPAAQKKKKI